MPEVVDIKKEDKPEAKPLEMLIIVNPNGSMEVKFPLLMDKITTYGFLKMAEKTLDIFYSEKDKSYLVKPKHGIMDFVRKN